MADEIALTKQVSDAKRAELLLQDELLAGAFNQLEHDYFVKWKGSALHERDGREHLWMAAQVIGKVRQHLHQVMAGGKLAERELTNLMRDKTRRPFRVI